MPSNTFFKDWNWKSRGNQDGFTNCSGQGRRVLTASITCTCQKAWFALQSPVHSVYPYIKWQTTRSTAQERVSDITKQRCINRNNVIPALYAVSLFWGHILQSKSHHHYYEHWHQCCCSLCQGLGHQEGPILHVVCQPWTASVGLCLLHHAAHQDHSIQPVAAIRRFWFGRIHESCFNLQTIEEIFQCG